MLKKYIVQSSEIWKQDVRTSYDNTTVQSEYDRFCKVQLMSTIGSFE